MNRKKVFLVVDAVIVLIAVLAIVLTLVLKNRHDAANPDSDNDVSLSEPADTQTESSSEVSSITESSSLSENSSVSEEPVSTAEESKISELEESEPTVLEESEPTVLEESEPTVLEESEPTVLEESEPTVPEEIESSEPEETPEWTETETSAELYVNTDGIWSRAYALMGSETVNQYSLNDKVTVTAITDTDYYKLSNGNFIHRDYLSETETEIPSTTITIVREDYTSTTANGYTIERVNGITYVDGIMIANKTYTLPSDYDPGTQPEAYSAFEQMRDAAANDGISLFIVSGYRSYYDQDAIYARYVYNDGVEQADTYSSRPGHSDHQTGYTFDLNSLDQSFSNTAEGIWLAEYCADYGFIIRYPEGKDAYTGYMYEPWHVRYIGIDKAKAITESGLSLEEYYGITSDYAYCED